VPERQTRLQRPVVSVGNLSMGGRGKTPLVALIARLLVEAGERPAILSRGYARRRPEDGVVVVSDGVHVLGDVDRGGDEPLMLARAVPGAAVLVCDQRALAGALAERALGATVHILDDGFQHFGLYRNLDLVVVTPGDLRDRALPFGRLREPIAALSAADALFVDGGPAGVEVPGFRGPVFVLRRSLGPPHALEPERGALGPQMPVVAVAGIAGPGRFGLSLEEAGWRVARVLSYRDHHPYDEGDMRRIEAVVAETGAAGVVTTEKDAMRLLPLRPFTVPVTVVPLRLDVEPDGAFPEWLRSRLAEWRS